MYLGGGAVLSMVEQLAGLTVNAVRPGVTCEMSATGRLQTRDPNSLSLRQDRFAPSRYSLIY